MKEASAARLLRPLAAIPQLQETAAPSTFRASAAINSCMTKLLDDAISTVRRLQPSAQDEIARAMLVLAGDEVDGVFVLTPEERAAIERSKAAADRGEFATDEEVAAVWAKHGL